MSDADLTYYLPGELALGELALGELAQDAPADSEICLEDALNDPLLAETSLSSDDLCLEVVQLEVTGTETSIEVADDPPNPVLPAMNEIFWSAVFFLILWALMKFVLLKPIRRLQAQRAQKLQDDRDAAQLAEDALIKAQSDYDVALLAAREEASLLLDEARSRASDRRAELVGAAVNDVSSARAVATQEMTVARSQAVDSLRSEIRELAVDAAANVLGNRPADTAVVDRTIDELLQESQPPEAVSGGKGSSTEDNSSGGSNSGDSNSGGNDR